MEMSVKMVYEETIEQKNIEELVYRPLYLSAIKMKELAMRNAPVDMGFLKNSIVVLPNTKLSDVYIIYCGAEYGLFIEYGTSPHWVPIKPLIEWAKRHGGDDNFGYALRGKIAKEGTNAHPFFRPAYNELKEVWIPRYFKGVIENV